MKDKDIEELLKEINKNSDNSWVFIIALIMFLSFNSEKKEEPKTIINIEIKETI